MTDYDYDGLFGDFAIDNLQDPWLSLNASTSLDPALFDMNWAEVFDSSQNPMSPFTLASNEQAPPSPPSSIDPLSPGQSDLSLAEYFKQATDEVYSQYMPRSNAESSRDTSYLSPATSPAASANCNNASEKIKTENSDLIQVEPDPSQLLRRRGPGRPSKAQLAALGAEKRLKGRSLIAMRRQIHNGSAMRSRARFNTVLDELWNEIPEDNRQEASMDASRQLSRAEKIEHVISYVRDLKRCRKF